jgi:hypothetical protein
MKNVGRATSGKSEEIFGAASSGARRSYQRVAANHCVPDFVHERPRPLVGRCAGPSNSERCLDRCRCVACGTLRIDARLFVSPTDTSVSLENWIKFWKSQFTRKAKKVRNFRLPAHPWQTDHWDTRLRNWRSYESKWEYVRNNPVRHGLVERAEDWPYQGEMHNLRWD